MANTNPGGVDLNTSPYFDDYNEDKKFLRVLYVPGRAVQARELTQQQTLNQVQIKRFADYFFKRGSIVEGCEIDVDLTLRYVKLQSTFSSTEVDVEDFRNEIVFGANSGIKALCSLVSDTEGTDPKTLFIDYLNSGSIILTVNNAATTITSGNTLTLSTGNTAIIDASYIDPITGANKLLVSSPNGAITTTTATTVDSTGATLPLNITAVTDKRSVDAANTLFNDNEIIFTSNVASRVYANTATTNATTTVVTVDGEEEIVPYGSKISVSEGVIYLSEHFIKHSTQTIILDKYTNTPSYKVGIVPNKSFVDFIGDSSLLDNAQGTPNFQAPGADRLKIDTVLTKYAPTEVIAEEEFATIVDIENGIVKERNTVTSEKQLDSILAQRTSEESGDYTLSDPIVTVREHALIGDNGGRYSVASGGNSNLLSVEIDPFTAYVSGYRNQLISKTLVDLQKGLDTEFVEQIKTQINYGQYIEVNEMVGIWDFMQGTKIDLYDTPQQAVTGGLYATASVTGTKIGEARVRAVEYVSGVHGRNNAVFQVYIYEVVMSSGQTFDKVRSIYSNSTPKKYADVILNGFGRAVLKESSFNSLIFNLPYDAIKTIRDDNENIESGFTFKKTFPVTVTAGVATLSSTDSSEIFSGNGILNNTQKNSSYMLVVNNSGANVETTALSGTVSVSPSSNAISGVSTSFTTELNVGDVVNVNSELVRIDTITDDTNLIIEGTHTAGASSNTFTKILPAGLSVDLTGVGGTGASRVVNVLSPGTISVDIKEAATFTADIVTTMSRTNAREKRKILNYQTQTHINPNTHPNLLSGTYGLGQADVFKIHAVYQSADFATPATTSSTNVTANYNLDTGQRDYAYEHGSIIAKPGVQPSGRLLVVFDHFTHDTSQGLGYASIDSYPINDVTVSNTTITTSQVPVFTSPTSKISFNLRDCIDFRPIKTANTSLNPIDTGTYQVPVGGLHIPKPTSDFDCDLIYYKGRISKVYIDQDGAFGINDGKPAAFGSQNPVSPPKLPNTLEVAEITVPPYPSLPTETKILLLKNKRYTMKDVSKINSRVEKLEYFTSLNYLEKEALAKSETDENGFDKFKNGILVDPFTGYSVANPLNADYSASIDSQNRYLTCLQDNSNTVAFSYNTSISETVKTTGNKIFLPYTQVLSPGLSQTSASRSLSLAEELKFNWVGSAVVVPFVDNWVDTVNDPTQAIVYNDTNADNWRSLIDAWNSEVAPLSVRWVGGTEQTGAIIAGTTTNRNTRVAGGTIRTTTSQASVTQEAFNQLASGAFAVSPAQEATGDRVVNVDVALYMRSRDFVIHATALKNNSRLYAFFDGINVTEHCFQIVLLNGNTVENLNDLYDNDGILTGQGVDWDIIADGSSDPLYVIDNEIFVLFTVPEKKFYVGQRDFLLTDDITNSAYVSTKAICSIYAQGVSQTKSDITINSRPFNVSFSDPSARIALGRRVNPSLTTTVTSRRFIPDPPPEPPWVFWGPDPLSQSFFVNNREYEHGFYITSIDLFFRTKSREDTRGVTVEIREVVNGYPSQTKIGLNDFARVMNPNINLSDDGTVPTRFTFKNPIYLSAGSEYCFSVLPDNDDRDFEIFIAELGEFDISNPENPTRIESAFQAGVLFSSSNNRTWTARQNQDMKFNIYIADFNTTPAYAYFENVNVSNTFNYDSLTPIIGDQQLSVARIDYEVKTSDSSFAVDSTWTSIKNFERITLNTRKQISKSSDETTNGIKSLQLRARLTSTNRYVTPYLDMENLRFAFGKNIINNSLSTVLTGTVSYSNSSNIVVGSGTSFTTEVTAGEYALFGDQYRRIQQIANNTYMTVENNFEFSNSANQIVSIRNEEHPSGIYSSQSRYITRVVTLNDGFEASDLTVYLDVNRPPGTTVKVYCKILNESDDDFFDDKFYTPMNLEGQEQFSLNANEYKEEKYVVPSVARTGGAELLAGKVAVSNTTTDVVGTSTNFINDLKIQDTISVGSARIERTVVSVSNNSFLTVDSPFPDVASSQDIFKVLNNSVAYTTPDGRTYNGYKYFAIKIVFTSSNPTYACKVKNLRALALT